MTAEHDERDGFGCMTAPDSGIPLAMSRELGERWICTCGRVWEIQSVAGFQVWQPAFAAQSGGAS